MLVAGLLCRQRSLSKPRMLHGDMRFDLGVEGCIAVQVVKNENALQAEGRGCIQVQRHESGCHIYRMAKSNGAVCHMMHSGE